MTGILALINNLRTVVNTALPVVAGLAMIGFFWGIARTIIKAEDPKARAEGRQFMVWSVIALFVMTMIWGIVRFIGDNLGIQSTNNPGIIQIPLSQ